jgi:HEAT repeat protein
MEGVQLRIAWLLSAAVLCACSDDAAEEPRMAMAPAPPEEPGMMRPATAEEAGMRAAPAAALTSRDATEREGAVLDFEGDLAALAPLATDDPSAEVRRAAVQRLADADGTAERAALLRALDDADPGVVAEAILALSGLDDAAARPAFERLLTHPDPELRALAEDALASLEP